MNNPENINMLWAGLIVEELVRNDVSFFCIAPGSRSAPLAVAAARHPKAETAVHFDERGLAFHSLGYAAATGKPAAVICTSGTALANLFPGVIETSKKKLPMVLLTADRPPELRHTGANQTIDQPGMFGGYVRWAVDMPCPDPRIPPTFVLTTIDQAVHRARRGNPPGPVHLNCMFREPLAPDKSSDHLAPQIKSLKMWHKQAGPLTRYTAFEKVFRPQDVAAAADIVTRARRGLIAVGKLKTDNQRRAVLKLARKLDWPLFPDVTSGLRLAYTGHPAVPYYDHILLSRKHRQVCRPDCVLHLGGRITSKRFYEFVEESDPKAYITVLNHPYRNDPLHRVTLRMEGPVSRFCTDLARTIANRPKNKRTEMLSRLSGEVGKTLEEKLLSHDGLTGPSVALTVSRAILPNTGLFLASSLPIRDMDSFAATGHGRVAVESNRGASGIDGTIATACGFAKGLKKHVTVITGDLALLHDLNSLNMVRDLKTPMTIIAVNNNGGGIFSFLPIAGHRDVFEPFFAAPPQIDSFRRAAGLFGLDYACPATLQELRETYERSVSGGRHVLIEAKTDREENVRFQKEVQEELLTILRRGRR